MWYLTVIEHGLAPCTTQWSDGYEAARVMRLTVAELSREADGPWLCVLTNPRGGEAARRQGV